MEMSPDGAGGVWTIGGSQEQSKVAPWTLVLFGTKPLYLLSFQPAVPFVAAPLFDRRVRGRFLSTVLTFEGFSSLGRLG